MQFGKPNWRVLTDFRGQVQFFWLDNIYYDPSNAAFRAKFANPTLLGANGEGPGAIPKVFFTGNAAAWNSGVNKGSGGNFTMTGAVTDYVPGPETIYTNTHVSSAGSAANWALRLVVPITGTAGTLGKVRVEFEAVGSPLDIEHASIGISAGGGNPEDTTATPVELTFDGGGHGHVVPAGTKKLSDWVNLAGFTTANKLAVSIDIGSSSAVFPYTSGLPATINTYYTNTGVNFYNVADITTITSYSNTSVCVTKIEVQ